MKKIILLSVALLTIASCARTQSGVSSGAITSWQDTIPGSINNSVSASKEGEACAINVLGIVAIGDSSIQAAKREGGIKNVAFTDTTYLNVLGVYQKGCTVVKGE